MVGVRHIMILFLCVAELAAEGLQLHWGVIDPFS